MIVGKPSKYWNIESRNFFFIFPIYSVNEQKCSKFLILGPSIAKFPLLENRQFSMEISNYHCNTVGWPGDNPLDNLFSSCHQDTKARKKIK